MPHLHSLLLLVCLFGYFTSCFALALDQSLTPRTSDCIGKPRDGHIEARVAPKRRLPPPPSPKAKHPKRLTPVAPPVGPGHPQTFWAGGDIDTMWRQKRIRNRYYLASSSDDAPRADILVTLSKNKLNAIRLQTTNGQCLGPSTVHRTADEIKTEMDFALDWGCIDSKVDIATQAAKLGMQLQLTINIGANITEEWRDLKYKGLAHAVQKETSRQLQPFLDGGVVPNVILFEKEGTMGHLLVDNSTGHYRGLDDGKASKEQLDKELCGEIPMGRMDKSYAQLAGLYKAQVIACNNAIIAARFDKRQTRYGLHTHGQYVDGKETNVHGPDYYSETEYTTPSGRVCNFSAVIPPELLNHKASDVLDIIGFTIHLDGLTPKDVNSAASIGDTFSFLRTTLAKTDAIAQRYGEFNSGPFKGQYRKQALIVEYESAFTKDQVTQQQAHTRTFWGIMKAHKAVLGALWYEPWGCFSYFVGGTTALCTTRADKTSSWEVPTLNMATFRQGAVSPWK